MSESSTGQSRGIGLIFPSDDLDLRQLQIVINGLDRIYAFAALTAIISSSRFAEENSDAPAIETLYALAGELSNDVPRPTVAKIRHESPLWVELIDSGTSIAQVGVPSYFFYRLLRGGFANVEDIVSFPFRAQTSWYEWRSRAERAKRDWESVKGAAGEPVVVEPATRRGETDWDDGDADLDAYKAALNEAGYAPTTIQSYVDRAAGYKRWRRTGRLGRE